MQWVVLMLSWVEGGVERKGLGPLAAGGWDIMERHRRWRGDVAHFELIVPLLRHLEGRRRIWTALHLMLKPRRILKVSLLLLRLLGNGIHSEESRLLVVVMVMKMRLLLLDEAVVGIELVLFVGDSRILLHVLIARWMVGPVSGVFALRRQQRCEAAA